MKRWRSLVKCWRPTLPSPPCICIIKSAEGMKGWGFSQMEFAATPLSSPWGWRVGVCPKGTDGWAFLVKLWRSTLPSLRWTWKSRVQIHRKWKFGAIWWTEIPLFVPLKLALRPSWRNSFSVADLLPLAESIPFTTTLSSLSVSGSLGSRWTFEEAMERNFRTLITLEPLKENLKARTVYQRNYLFLKAQKETPQEDFILHGGELIGWKTHNPFIIPSSVIGTMIQKVVLQCCQLECIPFDLPNLSTLDLEFVFLLL